MNSLKKQIAIIGRGISGLSSGIRLLEKGFSVDIYSRDELSKTTSMAAGAYWWPYEARPVEKVFRWSRRSFEEYQTLCKKRQSGVTFQQYLRFCKVLDGSAEKAKLADEWEEIDGQQFGISCLQAFRLNIPVIEVPIFMPYLEKRFLLAGGKIFIRDLYSPTELFSRYELVVNCSGVWAHYLVNDKEVFPIRGQTVRVSRPEGLPKTVQLIQDTNSFIMILPRSVDCVLGGVAEKGNWSVAPDDFTSAQILANAKKIQPLFEQSLVLDVSVGLRPGRNTVRLELEESTPGQPIIHNYGHGGAGFTLAWGCADEVANLASSYLG